LNGEKGKGKGGSKNSTWPKKNRGPVGKKAGPKVVGGILSTEKRLGVEARGIERSGVSTEKGRRLRSKRGLGRN